MSKYIMKTIGVNGTEVDMLVSIRDFFTTNTVIPFTLADENLENVEGEKNYINLKNDDYLLEFVSTVDNDEETANYGITIILYKNNSSKAVLYQFSSQTIAHENNSNYSRVDETPRRLPVFLIKQEELDFIIMHYPNQTQYGKGEGFYYCKLLSPEIGEIFGTAPHVGNYTSNPWTFCDYESFSIFYGFAPYHNTSMLDGSLIVDSEIAITNPEASCYLGFTSNLLSLGGGAPGIFYKDDTGEVLYCLYDNMCVKLGEKVEN